MGWKHGRNQVYLTGIFPTFYSPWRFTIFPLQLRVCVRLWRTDFPERKWKGLLAAERGRERTRSQGQRWGGHRPSLSAPSTNPPIQPAASQPAFTGLHKSTCRSHYCSPSSVFTAMLKIVITLVRAEIFNLDVFLRVRNNPAVAEGEVVGKRPTLAQWKRGGTTFGPRWEQGLRGHAL